MISITIAIVAALVLGVLLLVGGFFLGILAFPYVLHARASRSDALVDGKPFDKSNRSNTVNMIAHYGTRWEDFAVMQYEDGKRPFYYLTQDLTETLDNRPNK